jgi:hypothetical protein
MAFTLSFSLHAPETVIRDPELKTEQQPDQEKSAAVHEGLGLALENGVQRLKNRNKNRNLERSPAGAAKKMA